MLRVAMNPLQYRRESQRELDRHPLFKSLDRSVELSAKMAPAVKTGPRGQDRSVR